MRIDRYTKKDGTDSKPAKCFMNHEPPWVLFSSLVGYRQKKPNIKKNFLCLPIGIKPKISKQRCAENTDFGLILKFFGLCICVAIEMLLRKE